MYIVSQMGFIKKLIQFLKEVSDDERIPSRDKKVIAALIVLIISPIDLIPDWIPIIGLLDDLIMIAIILDYFFEVLDSEIILFHYPWGMKSFIWIRRSSRVISRLTPNWIKDKVWKYKPSPYNK